MEIIKDREIERELRTGRWKEIQRGIGKEIQRGREI